MRINQKIVLQAVRKPRNASLNDELQWLASSIGLFNLRDRDKSCFRLFLELLKASKQDAPVSSDLLASRLNLSRATVVHHMHKLIVSGIVEHEGKRYLLREEYLVDLVDEMEQDIAQIFNDIRETAKEIDKMLES